MFVKSNKRKAILVFLLCFSGAALAAFPIAGIIYWAGITFSSLRFLATPITSTVVVLGRSAAANVQVWKIAETVATVGAVGAIMLADKNPESATAKGKAQVVVHMNSENPKRANPDPEKWNDPKEGETDPTPKSLNPNTAPPVTGNLVAITGAVVYASTGQKVKDIYSLGDDAMLTPEESLAYEDIFGGSTYSYWNARATTKKYTSATLAKKEYSIISSDNSHRFDWIATDFYSGSLPECQNVNYTCTGSIDPSRAFTVSESHANNVVQPLAEGYKVDKLEYGANNTVAVHYKRMVKLCPDGYSYNSTTGSCMTGEQTKPATTPCEVIFKNGNFQTDANNPNCKAVADRLTVNGNMAMMKSADGETEIVRNADGTYTITSKNGENWQTINTGTYSSSGNGATVGDVSESKTGKFIYGGSFGTGSSSGSCGGSGQPPCSIDDSGFEGKDKEATEKLDELKGKEQEAVDNLSKYVDKNGSNNFGFTNFLPKLWPTSHIACENIMISISMTRGPFKGLSGSVPIEFCDKAQKFREFMSWLVYALAALYIYKRVTRSNSSD